MTQPKPPLPPDDLDEPVVEQEAAPVVEETAPPVPPEPAPAAPPPYAPPQYAPQVPAPHYGQPMDKSPGLALFLSIFFPGLGHIYTASYERALMIICGIGICVASIVFTEGRLWPLAFIIAFAYFFAIFDAFREAQIANLVAADQELPKPRQRGEGRLVFGVFLTVLAGLVLADNLGLFDIRWFYDWWPVLILLVGFYFIGSWIWEKMKESRGSSDESYD